MIVVAEETMRRYLQLEKQEWALGELKEILQCHIITVKLEEVSPPKKIWSQTMHQMILTMKRRYKLHKNKYDIKVEYVSPSLYMSQLYFFHRIIRMERQKKLTMNLSYLTKNIRKHDKRLEQYLEIGQMNLRRLIMLFHLWEDHHVVVHQ